MIKRILGAIFVFGFLGLLGLVALFYYYGRDLPKYEEFITKYNPPLVTRIYSSDGYCLEEYAMERRVFVPLKSIPDSIVQAFIAAEDKNFYSHPGIDVWGIARAAMNNMGKLARGKPFEGASTISQQVVKIFLLTSQRSISRKVQEIILALKISQLYTKDQIMELYLNQCFFGNNAYGIAAAAKRYFNKSIEELELQETALLAALLKFPSIISSPAKQKSNYSRIKARRDYVITRMKEDGYVTASAAEQAIKLPIVLADSAYGNNWSAPEYVEKVRQEVMEMFGREVFYTSGLTVITSLKWEYQKAARAALIKGIRAHDARMGFRGPIGSIANMDQWSSELESRYKKFPRLLEQKVAVVLALHKSSIKLGVLDGGSKLVNLNTSKQAASRPNWVQSSLIKKLKVGDVVVCEKAAGADEYTLSQIPELEGAVIVMDVVDGKVLAMVGSYDPKTSKFDRATQAQRQPGSSIKPFIYLTALEKGIPPNYVMQDRPIEIYQGPGKPLYSPQNYGKKFYGPLTIRRSLEMSRNTITVQLAQLVGLGSVANTISKYGINSNPPRLYSMSLGALETTLDKITSAYAAIANGGYKVSPKFIELIKNKDGKVLYKRDNRVCTNCLTQQEQSNAVELPRIYEHEQKVRLTDEATSYQMISMLKGCVERGTAASAKKLKQAVAGKTGTTNESKDASFIGFNSKIAVGTYVGFDQPKTLGKRATGGVVALPIFVDFMEAIAERAPDFKVPAGIELRPINVITGRPVGPLDYLAPSEVILEAFKRRGKYDDNQLEDPFGFGEEASGILPVE